MPPSMAVGSIGKSEQVENSNIIEVKKGKIQSIGEPSCNNELQPTFEWTFHWVLSSQWGQHNDIFQADPGQESSWDKCRCCIDLNRLGKMHYCAKSIFSVGSGETLHHDRNAFWLENSSAVRWKELWTHPDAKSDCFACNPYRNLGVCLIGKQSFGIFGRTARRAGTRSSLLPSAAHRLPSGYGFDQL